MNYLERTLKEIFGPIKPEIYRIARTDTFIFDFEDLGYLKLEYPLNPKSRYILTYHCDQLIITNVMSIHETDRLFNELAMYETAEIKI
jgi:hypothetical protein